MKKVLSSKDVAEMLQVSDEYVRQLCRKGKLACYKEGRRGGYKIPEKSVEDYIERKLKEGKKSPSYPYPV